MNLRAFAIEASLLNDSLQEVGGSRGRDRGKERALTNRGTAQEVCTRKRGDSALPVAGALELVEKGPPGKEGILRPRASLQPLFLPSQVVWG